MDPARRALQEMLVAQHDAGVLLCLCSKNDDADVMAVFEAQPHMPLRAAHLAVRRVNWRPKSENLRSLAAELGLRDDALRGALDFEAFLDGLALEVTIAPMTADALPRAAQLTQRTNHLNVTTRRRTAAELRALWQDGALNALLISVRDRFGAYGTTGLVLFTWTADALVIHTLLVSFRALGRGVEECLPSHLGRLAERGRQRVDVPFVPTAKNRPALDLLEGVGVAFRETYGKESAFRFPTSHLVGLRRVSRRGGEWTARLRRRRRLPRPTPDAAPC